MRPFRVVSTRWAQCAPPPSPDDVDEQLGHPRLGAGELAGGFDVPGLDGTA
ncbi:hypothetical protein ACIGBH_39480 [Streptomyces sp. NPDC085929]|uniref:hypothetical protein n=1 Tax=Streptomyces sp. NPDC085929 TaxID=3365739 RepID=UPI0037CE02D4